MNWLITNFYLFLTALVLALQEIQIEGKHGWAEKLPTWRPDKSQWYYKIIYKIFGNEITGYHLLTTILILLFFHLGYFFNEPFSLIHELELLLIYFLWLSVWDFLWFVFNPHYPLKNYRKGFIPWHEWFLGLPKLYWTQTLLSFLAVLWLIWLTQSGAPFILWIQNIIQFL